MLGLMAIIIKSGEFPGGPVFRICAFTAKGLGSIPGQGMRSRMPQLRAHKLQPEILSAAMKISSATADTQCGWIPK